MVTFWPMDKFCRSKCNQWLNSQTNVQILINVSQSLEMVCLLSSGVDYQLAYCLMPILTDKIWKLRDMGSKTRYFFFFHSIFLNGSKYWRTTVWEKRLLLSRSYWTCFLVMVSAVKFDKITYIKFWWIW